ncbi:MAG: hypothetical protein H7325_09675 [Pedobacter sp.]|nr:hypothetical protein [Pedobacter sp.]
MWKYIIGAFLIYVFFDLIGTCNKEEKPTDPYNGLTTQQFFDKLDQEDLILQSGKCKLLDSLNKVYQKKGFTSFAQLECDIDSISLTADYMAYKLSNEAYNKKFYTLKTKISSDRYKSFYKRKSLNREQVVKDLYLCKACNAEYKEYADRRYKADKIFIRNQNAKQLALEAERYR